MELFKIPKSITTKLEFYQGQRAGGTNKRRIEFIANNYLPSIVPIARSTKSEQNTSQKSETSDSESITSGNTKYALPIVILLIAALVATLPAVRPLLILFVPFLVGADYLT
jgi:hypothetical protein